MATAKKKTTAKVGTKAATARTAPAKSDWANIRLVVADVDGVLTDATVLYSQQGELAKPFFIRDGMGLRLLEAAGVRVAVITSEDSSLVRQRVERLMLSAYKPGMKRKGKALNELMTRFGVVRQQTVFIGDDVNDAEAMEIAGIAVCVADAAATVHKLAHYVTQAPGGRGAVREVADLILEARGADPVKLWAGLHPEGTRPDHGTV